MSSNHYEINDEIYLNDILTENDVPSLVKYLNNPNIYANTLRLPYPYTTKDGEDYMKIVNESNKDIDRFFTIRLKENDEMIGSCGIHGSKSNRRVAEIGYWLAEPFWRRGIASAAVKKALEILKTQCKHLVRIEAEIFVWNTASKALVEKCGFTFEGLLPKRIHKNGNDIDVWMYSYIIE